MFFLSSSCSLVRPRILPSRGRDPGSNPGGSIPMKKRTLAQKCKCPNNNLFITALIALILFLIVEINLRIFDLYFHLPWVDIPSHIFGGIAFVTAIFWIVSLTKIENKGKTSLFFYIYRINCLGNFRNITRINFLQPGLLKGCISLGRCRRYFCYRYRRTHRFAFLTFNER